MKKYKVLKPDKIHYRFKNEEDGTVITESASITDIISVENHQVYITRNATSDTIHTYEYPWTLIKHIGVNIELMPD